jgi:uncharacterized membrane protein YjjP (DUF1212 family)
MEGVTEQTQRTKMTFAQRIHQARQTISEFVEVTRIGMALQNREITAEQAAAAVAGIGASEVRRTDLDLASH